MEIIRRTALWEELNREGSGAPRDVYEASFSARRGGWWRGLFQGARGAVMQWWLGWCCICFDGGWNSVGLLYYCL